MLWIWTLGWSPEGRREPAIDGGGNGIGTRAGYSHNDNFKHVNILEGIVSVAVLVFHGTLDSLCL